MSGLEKLFATVFVFAMLTYVTDERLRHDPTLRGIAYGIICGSFIGALPDRRKS